ncbi:hypothetical protein [Nocardia salmonicida]|uniref:hypothetical protein n=1 Tax=Nocardia salmonicida TaxID=53431 RepID=UPI0007A4E503|nr:hypothetical protein [Nocardia salmonicida]
MTSRIHPIAGGVGLLTVVIFWTSTVVSELSGSKAAIIAVKQAIPWALPILVLALAVTGATGFRSAGDSAMPDLLAKKRRMPFIAGNGLLVLIPSAITLAVLAGRDEFGPLFYGVQTLELLAGATNIVLMSLNARDGLRVTGRLGKRSSVTE